MKFKALRKKDTKEFVEIHDFDGTNILFVSEIPNLQPMTADKDSLQEYFSHMTKPFSNFSVDDLEFIELELIDDEFKPSIGADIRNKLTPLQNLLSLLNLYFKEDSEENKAKLKPYILKELQTCDKSIKYLSNLL